jgi:glycosyltransferase involved in cell wall biosynthesis
VCVGATESTSIPPNEMNVAIVHDYLTQRGGAERVVLSLLRAFPDAPLYTSLYDPRGTFPEFARIDIRAMPMNAVGVLRRHHRVALPLLGPSFSRLRVPADVVICSSSGWAHGAHVEGRKLVYCHTPARWLYQPDRYLRGRRSTVRMAFAQLRPVLERWDKRSAASADQYLANSSMVAEQIASLYGRQAEVLPPPPAITPGGDSAAPPGIEPGFALTVSRLLPYKNIDAIVRAFAYLPEERLVVAGSGPEQANLRATAGTNVHFTGRVEDAELRWLYANCRYLVTASYEDFGLTPVEAAGFGKPTAALRFGGFLDTVREGQSGMFFDRPTPDAIADLLRRLLDTSWNAEAITHSARRFSEARFIRRIQTLADTATGSRAQLNRNHERTNSRG